MPWVPSEPGEVPTLGFEAIDWIRDLLAAPDCVDYEPFVLYAEQEDWVLRFYEIDPVTGKRKHRRGVISRPRGWGKSPFLAALACFEALGPAVPDGWDANGQPVGKPWVEVRTPLVQIVAVSDEQTKNTWTPLLEMLDGPVLDEYPGLEPMETFVSLPGRGRIEARTSGARSIKGARPIFAVMDQTEEWVQGNGGKGLFQKMKSNAAKVGGSFVESPNAFTPGEDSVAEDTANYWKAIQEGRSQVDPGLFYSHREAPAETDLFERESLIAGLRAAYGDSSGHPDGCVIHDPPCPPGHMELEPLVGAIWSTDSDVQVSRSDFLNQVTHASDAWLTHPQWNACGPKQDDPESFKVVADKEAITLGFDGSRSRARGSADATALVGCRVSDGHLFEIQVWEQPSNVREWRVPTEEVDAKVRETFQRFNVVGFYADPAKWETFVAAWEARYGERLQVKATRSNPIEWWITGGSVTNTIRALDQFHSAVLDREMTHCGSSALSRHVTNARRRATTRGYQIAKEHPDSSKKIDAAVAAVLAWQARIDALSQGVNERRKSRKLHRF